jgi:hypothetical protein
MQDVFSDRLDGSDFLNLTNKHTTASRQIYAPSPDEEWTLLFRTLTDDDVQFSAPGTDGSEQQQLTDTALKI